MSLRRILFSIPCLLLATVLHAQQKVMQTLRFKTSVECAICEHSIESYLKREPGVTYVHVDYHTKEATVRYYTDQMYPSLILTDVANLGYDADTVQADPDAYRRLPDCCKKGGMARLRAAQAKRRSR